MRGLLRRAWWSWRRGLAAGVFLWACVVYPASVGPVAYLEGRGWLPSSLLDAYIVPIQAVYEGVDDAGDAYEDYVDALDDLGQEHARR